jgi:hypothetical protein
MKGHEIMESLRLTHGLDRETVVCPCGNTKAAYKEGLPNHVFCKCGRLLAFKGVEGDLVIVKHGEEQ